MEIRFTLGLLQAWVSSHAAFTVLPIFPLVLLTQLFSIYPLTLCFLHQHSKFPSFLRSYCWDTTSIAIFFSRTFFPTHSSNRQSYTLRNASSPAFLFILLLQCHHQSIPNGKNIIPAALYYTAKWNTVNANSFNKLFLSCGVGRFSSLSQLCKYVCSTSFAKTFFILVFPSVK